MDLLCIDFTQMEPSKDDKENIIVMTDVFSKFSVAAIVPNQQVKMVAKAQVDKWFYTFVIPSGIHIYLNSFDNNQIKQLCMLYGIEQSTTRLYNHCGNSIYEQFNRTLHNLLKTVPKTWKPNWPAHLSALVFVSM